MMVSRSGLLRPRPRLVRDLLLLSVVVSVIALDQLSKLLVQLYLELGESFPAHGFARLTHITNTGGAFGLFTDRTLLLTAASFIGVAVLLLFYRTHPWPGRLVRLSLGLQLGGAVGNLIDRLHAGAVVDFIDLGPWPVFNLADSSIVLGLALLLGLFLFSERERQTPSPGRTTFLVPSALTRQGPWTNSEGKPAGPPPEVGC